MPPVQVREETSLAPSPPRAIEKEAFLPNLAPTPVAATSARAPLPSPSSAPRFVVQSPLKSESPSRKKKTEVEPTQAKQAEPEPEPAAEPIPASDKVVDITTAISVRAPQKPNISRSAIPEEIRAALSKLNQRIDRLEDAVLDLENQLEDFDLDFGNPATIEEPHSTASADSAVEAEVESNEDAETLKSDRDGKTIAA